MAIINGNIFRLLCTAVALMFVSGEDVHAQDHAAAASRSYYDDLLAAGVGIHEYAGGLLHTKSLTIDGQITLIGSANMDRRSFELNYENNILFYDQSLTADMRERQQEYILHSRKVSAEIVENWPWHYRLWNNTIAMLGPVL